MVFHGFHGVLPEERVLGQKFVVDTWIIVRAEITGPPHLLLESLAYSVGRQLLLTCPELARVALRVSKPHVAFTGVLKSVGIQLECKRQTLREGVQMGDTEEKKDRRGEEGEGGEMQGQRDIETLLNKTEREEEDERGGKQGQGDATVVVVEGESSMLVLEGQGGAGGGQERRDAAVVVVEGESSMLVLEGLVFYCQGRGGRGEGKKGGEGGEGGFSGAGVKNSRAGVESCYTRVEVDVCAWVNLAAAAQSDELQDSVDYGEIYTIARRHVESHQSPPLASLALPPLARTIAMTIRTSLPCVKRVWVRLAAPAPASLPGVVGSAAAQVTL
ncbi:unnamed protein product [Closterium sp. NIES-64]|nr:unnamed protein product [Closterium sp. NIES-64]